MRLERAVVLVNASAGGGRSRRTWERLLRRVPEVQAARRILADSAPEARRKLDEELRKDVLAVVAIGGDGTAHLAVNAILDAERGGDVAFALVPAGTGSDLARCLGLPRRPEAAMRRALECPPRPIDVLEITTDGGERRFAVNITSAGVSGAAGAVVGANPNRGPATYVLTALRELLRFEPVPCRVTVDGEELFDDRFFIVAVANGRCFGHGVPIAPGAEVDDGLADVVVVPRIPLWRVPFLLPRLLTGRHLKLSFIRTRRGGTVRFEPRGELPPYEADGETLPGGPATVRVLPGALRLLA